MTSKDEKRTKISLVDTKNHILESYSGIPHPKPSSSFSQLHSINKSLGFLSIKTTSSNIFQSNLKPQSYEFTETGKRKLNTYFSSSCKNRFLLNQNVTNPFLSKEETRDEDKYFSLKFTSIKRNLSLTSLEEDTHNIFTQKYHSSKIHKKDDDDDYEMPKYKFESLCFENVSKDEFVKEILMLDLVKEEEEKLKMTFLSLVSTSLLYSPKFQNCDDTFRQLLLKSAEEVANKYPEFILKVALYIRKELNIRTTANFLLAYASFHKNCRPFLKKYFKESICLPTDWMEVAEIYKTLLEKDSPVLPASLRRVMIDTFTKFDEYQLAKYNRDKSKRRKRKKPINKNEKVLLQTKIVPDEAEININKQSYTLKRLIRLLHITKPVEYVMCLIGKKYPSDLESFNKCNLPGIWDETKAGKRMKLPVPETWETKLSTKGNKASVWQNLLDQKKLPYMAMLRNLRNLIVTGISKKHHQQVVNTISSEKAVIKSKQFPLRFFAAYQAIQELQSLLESDLLKSKRPTTYLVQRKQALPAWKVKLENKIWQRLKNFDESLLKKYKHAIDSAVEIAARRNVNPIQGRTLIICDILSCFDHECAALKGSLINKMHYGCLMLALMISYACEEFDLKAIINDQMWCTPEISDEKILDNVFNLMNNFNITFTKEEAKDAVSTFYNEKFSVLLEHYLCPLTTQGIQFDNIIFLTSGNNFESTLPSSILKDFMKKYRNTVNKNVLHVEVDLTGNQNSFDEKKQSQHPNDVFLHGFSDQLLRFIAERGNGSQLNYVENIDKKYSLKSMPKPRPSIKDESNVDHLTSNLQIQKWKTVRIFISSTFKDMHGERDLIVRFIIPELRARAKTLNVNIQEVDLRWGITEAESNNSKSLEICLSEVARCEYFLGILGERYGQIAEYNVSNNPEFDWLQEYPLGASLTELEIYCAALADPSAAAERSFFYFRDKMFESQIPEKWKDNFVSENEFNHIKMENLKQRIKESGLEVFNNYPCYWGGVVNDEPVVAGLEEFGQRVLENLWNSLCKYYKKDEISYSDQRLSVLHASYAEAFHQIEGRDSFVKNCVDNILSKSGLFLITGKSGYGKTAVMAELCKVNQLQPVFPYFVGIDSRSFYLHNLLYDLLTSISNHFSIKFQIPNKLENLCSIFHDILEVAVQESTHNRLIIFIDGLDQLMNKNSQDLDWLPVDLPTGVKIILSTATDSFTYKILSERSKYQKNIYKFELAALVMSDREKIVNNDLLPFRKTLDTSPFNNQLLMLISKREAGIPLFLHIACEELKSFGQYENLTSKLRQYPQTLYLLLREILKQLDNIHGKNIVCIALCLISISPEGLDEFELHALISIFNCILNINSSFEEFLTIIRNLKPEDIFVPLKFSALLRTLHGFLRLTEDMKHTLNIKHADFIKAIIDHYNVGKNLFAYHKLLAAYFYNEVKYVCKWDNVSSRCLHLLLYHLNAAEQFNELSSLLCTIEFLKTAIKAGISLEILDYYEMLKSNKLTKNVYLEKLEDFNSFYSQNLHILQRYPGLIYQQALNEQITSSVFKEAAGYTHSNVIRWLTKPKIPTACYLTLSNLKQAVISIAVSKDGRKAAFGKNDGIVQLVNSLSGKVIRTFTGHKEAVCCLCFVGNNKLCTASIDTTISIWDIDKGHRLHLLKGHNRRVSSCCSSPCGKFLISVSWDNTLRVWNVLNGCEINAITNIKSPLNCIAHHLEKSLVVTGGWDKKIKIWDLITMTRTAVLKGHTSSIRAVDLNNQIIISGSFNGELFYWSLNQGIKLGQIVNDLFSINCITISTNGNFLIVGNNNSTLKVWSYHSGHIILKEKVKEAQYLNFLSPEYIAIGFKNEEVLIINIKTKRHQKKFINSRDSVTCLELIKNSEFTGLIVGTYSGKLMLGDLTKPDFKYSADVNKPITSIASHEDNIVGGLDNGDLFIISLNHFNPTIFSAHQSSITKCIFYKEDRIITVSKDCCLKIWLLEDGNITQQFTLFDCHKDWILSCSYKDNILATCSQDCTVKLWNIETMENVSTLTGLNAPVKYVTLEDNYVIAGTVDGSIGIWTKFGDTVTSISALTDHNLNLEPAYILNKDEKVYQQYLASVDENDILTVRKPFNKPLVATLECHTGPVTSSCTTPKDTLISCSSDKSVRFWKLPSTDETESQLCSYHKGKITGIGFLPNKQIGFSCDISGKLIIWSFNLSDEQNPLIYNTEKEWQMGSVITTVCSQAESKQILISAVSQRIKVEENTENSLEYFVVALHLTSNSTLNELQSYYLDEEVSSMNAGRKNIVIGLKSGSVMITDNYLKSQRIIKMSNNWIMNIALSKTDELFVTDISGNILMMPCRSNNQEAKLWKENDDEYNWPSACILHDEKCYIGKSDGSLYILSENETYQYQIHIDKINDLCVCDNYLFTCSQDRIIKIWNLHNIKQVGQFFLQLPVVVLTTKQVKSTENLLQVLIMCGTKNGKVHLLTWNN